MASSKRGKTFSKPVEQPFIQSTANDNSPAFRALLLKTTDITERGFSRTLYRRGILRLSKAGKVFLSHGFTVKALRLYPKVRRGLALAIQTTIEYKQGRRTRKDTAPSVLIHSEKYYKDTKRNIPKAILTSFLFALDRNRLRGDYQAYFRKRVGQALKRKEQPKTKQIKISMYVLGYRSRTMDLNI